jgi:tetratricopeptide (TPR) repeat protein
LAEDSESDFLRAVSYAGRVIDLNPDGGAGYRLRGAIHLARYERLAKASPPAGASALEQSLAKAELDLSEAIQKGTAESVDAGAYYNQALVRYYRGDIEGAVRVSRQLLGLESKISRLQREKYLPSIYVNLGSFLAKLAKRAAEENQLDAVRQFSSQAVEAIARGVEDFKKTEMQDGGLARLKELLRSELDSNQELNGLGQTYRDQLEVLLGGGAANGSQSNPEKRS